MQKCNVRRLKQSLATHIYGRRKGAEMQEQPGAEAASDAGAQFAAIVGAENVRLRGDGQFEERYRDPYWFDKEYSSAPRGAVLPRETAEVQAVVRLANELGVALWPVSRGRNLGYGGASPARDDAFVLDLGRMDQVLHIDSESAYAVVEPGVSFFALAEALKKDGGKLWPSVPDLGWGSVLGNALERGFGYTSYGNHSSQLCGLEVVLPDGELIRTGMGAHNDSSVEHMYKGGYGPSLDGLFQQSNLGIVVRAGIWLMPRPEEAAMCLITMPEAENLPDLADLVRPLQIDGTIDGVAILGNTLAVASQLMPRSAIWDGDGAMPTEAIRAVADKLGIGFWNAKFGLYGASLVVEAKLEVIAQAVALVPGAKLEVRRYPGTVASEEVHPADRSQMGIPSGDLIQMAAWRGGTPAHTDFSLVAPTTGREAKKLVDLVRARVEAVGLDHVGGFTMFGRHAVMLTLLAFDADSADERTKIEAVFRALLAELAEAGFVPYRAHPAFMDEISELYDYNDQAHRRTVQRIKSVLDPKGILAPGKQGVWPVTEGAK